MSATLLVLLAILLAEAIFVGVCGCILATHAVKRSSQRRREEIKAEHQRPIESVADLYRETTDASRR